MNANMCKLPLVLLFCLMPCVWAKSQQNIAPNAMLSTSYVSAWENLAAINDGYEPLSSSDHSHGAYGNWQSGVSNTWNWVQYTFSSLYNISQSNIYWWTDQSDITSNAGVQMPYKCYIEYWDFINHQWLEVKHATAFGVEKDMYNVTRFDTVLTNKIRIHFISLAAQGIVEWQVLGAPGEQVPEKSHIETNKPLRKNDTTEISLFAFNKDSVAVEGYVFRLNALITNNVLQNNEVYTFNGVSYTQSAINIPLPATDANGVSKYKIHIPALIDPTDGLQLKFNFNDGITELASHAIFEPGLAAPLLIPDTTDNNIDNTIDIAFADNEAWRAAIKSVLVDGVALRNSDFSLKAGMLSLMPLAGNELLTRTGSKTIAVVAEGYENTQVAQYIGVGAIDMARSGVLGNAKFYKSSTVTLQLKAADRCGNAIEGYSFSWKAQPLNTNSLHTETYIVNGVEVLASVSGYKADVTNSEGVTKIKITVPAIVDLGDGFNVDILLADATTQLKPAIQYLATENEKGIYIPADLRSYKWSYDRTAQSDNFIIYWGDLIGTDPVHPANGDMNLDFDPAVILAKLEKYLALYTDSFGFIPNKTSGNMAKYKFDIVITDTWSSGYKGGWATGGSVDGVIGAMWVHPNATGGSGFVIAHEFAHMLQAMIPIQYPGKGIKDPANGAYMLGMFWESHANFMAVQATGDLSGDAPERWVNTAMMQYSSTRHYYQNSYFLQYILDTYGMEEVNKIWRNADVGEHPLLSFAKNMGLGQEQLDDEVGKYAQRNVTWDYAIHDKITSYLREKGYAGVCRQYTILDTLAGQTNTYIVPRQLAPADYGYNIIPLYPAKGASEIIINFSGFDNEPAGGAGWRYGFVATDKTGKPSYSVLYSEQEGVAKYTIAPADSAIYLVVVGAPKKHHNYHDWEPGWPKIFRYPYRLKITGALPEGYLPGYNSLKTAYPGAPHANGGGWVATTASVAATAYVGPQAQVLGKAVVSGNARVEDFAIVTDNAVVSNSAIVRQHAMVGSQTKVREKAIVGENARVFLTSDIHGNALITGSAIVYNSTVYGNAVVKDLAWLYGATLSAGIVVGGDAEDFTTCTAGTYLQLNGLRNCDKKDYHALNVDVNPNIAEYQYPIGNIPTSPANLEVTNIGEQSADLNWAEATDNTNIAEYIVVNGKNSYSVSNATTYSLPALKPNTQYTVWVEAHDNTGNISQPCNAVTFTTLATDINDLNKAHFSIFPNPVTNYVTITSTSHAKADVAIFDNMGRVVYKCMFNASTTISKSNIGPAGIYFVKISESTGQLFYKISVK